MTASEAAVGCTIRCRASVAKKGCASIAERSVWRLRNPAVTRIRLWRADDSDEFAELRVVVRENADKEEIFVAPGVLGLVERQEVRGLFAVSTAANARRRWLFHTQEGWLAVGGLALAFIAAAVNVALLLGDVAPLIAIGSFWIVVLKIAVVVLGLLGVALVFWGGLIKH